MGFIKTTSQELTGIEKTAILLAEIGPMYNNNYDALMDSLHLSTDEKERIRKAMVRLGTYRPAKKDYETGMAEIKREQAVLNEVIEFGKRRGIFHPVEHSSIQGQLIKRDVTNGLAEMAKNNPQAVADILAKWIGE